jgi:hypothetical protein
MPRYYFNVRTGNDVTLDPEGEEMPDTDAARAEAILAAMQILAEKVSAGQLVDGQTFEIVDDSGEMVAVVPFQDALKLQ